MTRSAVPWMWAALVLVGAALWSSGAVLHACRPDVPLFDHAVLLADMLHHPPHLWEGHNEHRPIVPRLIFWFEARFTAGDPRVGVAVAVGALGAAAAVACRVWQHPHRWVWAAICFAGTLRPSLAWSASWPTNLQYPLALLGAAIALEAFEARRPERWVPGVLMALGSSAEGVVIMAVLAGWMAVRRQWLHAVVCLLLGAVAAAWLTTGEGGGLRLPTTQAEWVVALHFVRDLWAYPWSWKLWGACVGGLGLLGVRVMRQERRHDPVLLGLALYGVGFFCLVVIGRWWLGEVHHRYALGGTVAVVALVAALGIGASRGRAGGLAVVLAGVLAVEAWGLGPAIAADCRVAPPPGTAFWQGRTDDGTAAHPGFPADVVLELRAHLWRAGLYGVPEAVESTPNGGG